MQTSPFSSLKQPTTVVLNAGHGGGDSGATFGRYREADETIALTRQIAANLTAKGLNIHVVPEDLDLKGAIRYVNRNFAFGQAWALDIHRDSAESIGDERASKECGVYYGSSQESQAIGSFIRQCYLREGANSHSWSRSHTTSRFGRLGWIVNTAPLAHLLELGYMEGSHAAAHMTWLAQIASIAVYESFTGTSYHLEPTDAPPDAPSLIGALAKTYVTTDLKALFRELGITGVDPARSGYLKVASLAQWILESGWGTSRLAVEHNNFGGLKYRPEMEGFATSVRYEAHDGPDNYCEFDSKEAFIKGYWKFLTRAPYEGWKENTGSPEAFIRFLLRSGYTTDPQYADHVAALFPKAEQLLT
jgi:hypothetical protein